MPGMSESWLRLIADPHPWTPPDPLPGPIETPRLIVRRYDRGDGEAIFRAVEATRASILPWMIWAPTDQQHVEDAIYYVEKHRRRAAQPDCRDFPLGIFDRATGELIGGTSFHDVRPGVRQAEVGYWLRADQQGAGRCTEAIRHLLAAAFTPATEGGWGFRRIVIYCAAINTASKRVCEKLGLRLEVQAKQDRYQGLGPNGEADAPGYVDTLGFAALHDEWDGTCRPL